jgi:hypothetical protein
MSRHHSVNEGCLKLVFPASQFREEATELNTRWSLFGAGCTEGCGGTQSNSRSYEGKPGPPPIERVCLLIICAEIRWLRSFSELVEADVEPQK